MARRRVLALGPAVSRMACMSNPYQQMRRIEEGEEGESTRPKRRPWLWSRKMKSMRLGGRKEKKKAFTTTKRRWGMRVGRLKIRMLSPLALLKRLCDSYVKMMLSLENKMGAAGVQCMSGPAFPIYPMPMPGRMGVSLDFSPKVR